MITCLAVSVAVLSGCSGDVTRAVGLREGSIGSSEALVESVYDLSVAAASDSSVTLDWSAVGDGTGGSASYRIRYGVPPLEWLTGSIGCELTDPGTAVGDHMSCSVYALDAGTTYEFQLMSYRRARSGVVTSAAYSNVATGRTDAAQAGTNSPGLALADTAGLTVTESGGADDFTVVLTARPTANVVVDVSSADTGEAAVAATRLTFSPAVWNVPQTVSVRGVDDALADGDVVTTVALSIDVAASAAEYGSVGDETVAVTTVDDDVPTDSTSAAGGIWIGSEELAGLPTSGSAWLSVLDQANSSCGSVDLADQEQTTNVCILAKALVFARTGDASYRSDVVGAIREIASSGTYVGRALSLGRELGAYVVAADLIDLPDSNPSLDGQFRAKLRELLTTYTSGAASSLVDCHERRPNNWGTMCGASRAAVAVYLGDTTELARVAQVFKGFLGDRSSYAGFSFGELSWQCDPDRPVAINPSGCQRYGQNLDGVIPDDQRRAGPYSSWPPPKENYVWESLQGIVVQAAILERAGYPAFDWEDRAILRAVQWLHTQADFQAVGDDTWVPHVVNHFYGSSFPAPVPARSGKNMGWTDWTHGP